MNEKKRTTWIDLTKCFACLTVIVGHILQSMQRSSLLAETDTANCILRGIYHVNVPLFLICSGYLYQEYKRVGSLQEWRIHICHKLKTIGVPYVLFVVVIWAIKKISSDYVHLKPGTLIESLLIQPISPYWFLLCLLIFFIVIPTFNNKVIAIIYNVLAIALYVFTETASFDIPFTLEMVTYYMIWFVVGMDISLFAAVGKMGINVLAWCASIVGVVLFVIINCTFTLSGSDNWVGYFLISVLGCASIILLAVCISSICMDSAKGTINRLAVWTWPIFLLHTIFAAGVRVVLSRLGVDSLWIHMVCGMAVGTVAPVVVYEAYRLVAGKWLRDDRKEYEKN